MLSPTRQAVGGAALISSAGEGAEFSGVGGAGCSLTQLPGLGVASLRRPAAAAILNGGVVRRASAHGPRSWGDGSSHLHQERRSEVPGSEASARGSCEQVKLD